jgi:hypothetical protein
VTPVSMPFDSSYISDPCTTAERLRQDAPVHHVTSPDDQPLRLVTGYAAARDALADPRLFLPATWRVLARERRQADQRSRTLIAAVCPGLIDTAASRPWFDDMHGAQTPTEAAAHLLTPALDPVHPATYGELVQFRRVRPWL